MLNHDDRLPSVVIGLLSLKSFRSAVSDTQPQPQKQQLITGLVFILESVLLTAHWITARIWYELGLRVGLVESDVNLADYCRDCHSCQNRRHCHDRRNCQDNRENTSTAAAVGRNAQLKQS